MSIRSHVQGLSERVKWAVFAVGGDDRRRAVYWHALARLRAGEMAERRAALAELPEPPVRIPPDAGFVICDREFGDLGDVVSETVRRASTASDPKVLKEPEDFGTRLDGLPTTSALARFALDEGLLATAAAYLGMVPILAGIQIMRASAITGPTRGSQLFHCDHDDLRQVKVFVLCSEVAEANGPLTLLSARASRQVKEAVHYRYGGRSLRVPDDRVASVVAPGEVTAFTGSPGRLLLVDTSTCLHFGARIDSGAEDRLMVQIQYLTPPAFALFLARRRRPGIVARDAGRSHVGQLVLAL